MMLALRRTQRGDAGQREGHSDGEDGDAGMAGLDFSFFLS
jgi:hypothetical protein